MILPGTRKMKRYVLRLSRLARWNGPAQRRPSTCSIRPLPPMSPLRARSDRLPRSLLALGFFGFDSRRYVPPC